MGPPTNPNKKLFATVSHSTNAMAKVLNCGLEVSEFELQSLCYYHFRINPLGEGMNLLIPSAVGWIISLLFFYKDVIGIK